MTDRIIALVDGSIYSRSVCDHAGWVAGRMGAGVDLLHVLGRREGAEKSDLSGSIQLGARSALLTELAELDAQRAKLVAQRGRAILDDARAVLEAAGVAPVGVKLRHGDLVETVAELEQAASMIVIGKRGEAADFAREHLGSNLERIARAAHRPVLVAARAFHPIERVLVAFDGRASALKTVEHLATNPLFEGLALHLVTVGEETQASAQALQTAKAALHAAGRQVEVSQSPGQPGAVLAQMVVQGPYDMVVMGAYGHSRIRRLILGSTTAEMIRSCKVPVLLVR